MSLGDVNVTWTGRTTFDGDGVRVAIAADDGLDHAAEALAERGCQRPLLLASPSAASDGRAARAAERLGVDPRATFTHLTGHARQSSVSDLVDRVPALDVDAVVALGGGTVSDTAKGVVHDLAERGAPTLPLVCLPTTLSAAEMTPAAGRIDEAGMKQVVWDQRMRPFCVVFGAAQLRATPALVLSGSAFNAMAHCLEGLYSPERSPITDAWAEFGVHALMDGLTAEDGAHRWDRLSSGAALAGLVVSRARSGLEHAVCHALGARAGVGHGDAHSVMLGVVVRHNVEGSPMAATFARMGVNDLVTRLDELRVRLGLPTRLRDIGVARDVLADVARATWVERGVQRNVRPVRGPGEIEDLLTQAW